MRATVVSVAAALSLIAACSADNPGAAPVATTSTATTQAPSTTVAAPTTTAAPTTEATTTTQLAPEALCPGEVATFGGLSQVLSPNRLVAADGTATFTFTDPTARRVKVTGTWDGTSGYPHTDPMRSDGAGTWAATIGPLAPGTYRYVFEVDGADTLVWVGEAGVRLYSSGQPGGARADRLLYQAKLALDDVLRLKVV